MNGYVAVAAGIALVALGTAVKGRVGQMSRSMSGGGGGRWRWI
jgi:hypothetical protein